MAPRRQFVPGLSHHVTHRGNNRGDVFRDDCDRRKYLDLLGKASRERGVALHGYTLMTTHVHVLVTAQEENSLPRMMQSLGRSYVRYFNARHHRSGTLWEGRYWAGLIPDHQRWFTCLRYIEMNPVAARMVAAPDAYPWTSYQLHGCGVADDLLTLHPFYLQLGNDAASRRARWSVLCGQPIPDADLSEIRTATRKGTVIGLANLGSDLDSIAS
jgi:putative transposase